MDTRSKDIKVSLDIDDICKNIIEGIVFLIPKSDLTEFQISVNGMKAIMLDETLTHVTCTDSDKKRKVSICAELTGYGVAGSTVYVYRDIFNVPIVGTDNIWITDYIDSGTILIKYNGMNIFTIECTELKHRLSVDQCYDIFKDKERFDYRSADASWATKHRDALNDMLEVISTPGMTREKFKESFIHKDQKSL